MIPPGITLQAKISCDQKLNIFMQSFEVQNQGITKSTIWANLTVMPFQLCDMERQVQTFRFLASLSSLNMNELEVVSLLVFTCTGCTSSDLTAFP